MRDPRRKTLAIDFDGVLNPMAPEAPEVLRRLRGRYKLVVFTARRDHDIVRVMLEDAGVSQLFEEITHEKPRADLYVDDHGFHFTGDWDEVERAAAQL